MAYAIDRKRLQAIQDDITAALDTVAAKHSVAFTWGNGHYGDTADLKLKIAPVSEDGVVESEERTAWQQGYGLEYRGLKQEWLDREVTINDKRYRIAGLKPRSPKFCVLVTNVRTGKDSLYTADAVIRAVEREEIGR